MATIKGIPGAAQQALNSGLIGDEALAAAILIQAVRDWDWKFFETDWAIQLIELMGVNPIRFDELLALYRARKSRGYLSSGTDPRLVGRVC